jgi:hypothetical protein
MFQKSVTVTAAIEAATRKPATRPAARRGQRGRAGRDEERERESRRNPWSQFLEQSPRRRGPPPRQWEPSPLSGSDGDGR